VAGKKPARSEPRVGDEGVARKRYSGKNRFRLKQGRIPTTMTKYIVQILVSLGACASLALFSGCATRAPAVSSHPDATAPYANYKSFMMLRPAPQGGNPDITPTLVRQARENTEAALAAKGLVKSSDAYADLLVLVHGGLSEKVEVQDWGLSYGRFAPGFARRQEFDVTKRGSLFIDVFDAKTREMVWRGSIVAEMDKVPEPDRLKAAIEAIVARYPN
jgi:hypothetical protein